MIMTGGTRDRMVQAARALVAQQGTHGTSFADVLGSSGAPRGSLYHHFPGGKAELVEAVVDAAGRDALQAVEAMRGKPAAEVARGFLGMWRQLLDAGGFAYGCAVAGATVDAESPAIVARGGAVFRSWTEVLASVLADGGVPAGRAGSLAGLLIAASEGAVVVARAERDLAGFDDVSRELVALVEQATTRTA